MTTASSTGKRTATYKGKTYRVLFVGDTKYGRRAHLEFMNGGKDFWVDAGSVTLGGGYSPTAGRRSLDEDDRCEVCDRNKWTCGHRVGW